MKKALVILLTLAMVGAAFAEDVVAPTISGGVQATWGYDLELEAGGFDNDSDVVVTFPFAAFGDKSNSGEGMWGEVKVEDFGLKFDNDTTLDLADNPPADPSIDTTAETNNLIEGGDFAVTGIIHFNENVALTIYDVPDLGYNYAVNYHADGGARLFDVNTNSDWIGGGVGVALGYASDMVTVELSTASFANFDVAGVTAYFGDTPTALTVATEEEYDGADTSINTDNLYLYSAFASVKPAEMLTVNAAFTMIPEDYTIAGISINGFNLQAIVAVAPLTITVGSDILMFSDTYAELGYSYGDETMFGDVEANVAYAVADGFSVAFDVLSAFSDTEFDTAMPLDLKLVATEDLATGFVPNLGAVVEFAVVDVLGEEATSPADVVVVADDGDDLEWSFDVEVSYLLAAGLTAAGTVGYDYAELLELGASLEMGAEFHKIANTTFTAEFYDYADAAVDTSDYAGTFALTARIDF